MRLIPQLHKSLVLGRCSWPSPAKLDNRPWPHMGGVACCCLDVAADAGAPPARVVETLPVDVNVGHCAASGAASSGDPGTAESTERRGVLATDLPEPEPPESASAVMPPLLNMELVIMLEREIHAHMGLQLDSMDGFSAFVDDIHPGAIHAWNCYHPPHMNLQVHDRIVGVNGIRGDPSRLLQEMKTSTQWVLTIQRPTLMHIVVGASLGLDLKYSPQGRSLLIAEVHDGTIKQWNESAQFFKVEKNDRIVEVNGFSGPATALLCPPTNSTDTLALCILHFD